MGFDISDRAKALEVEDVGAIVDILDENDDAALDDDGNAVSVTVCGMNSATYRATEAWQRKELRSYGGRALKPDEQAALQARFVARCCKAWSGFTDGGKPVPFSVDAVSAMFLKLPYVQRQVERAMGQHQRFLAKT